MKYNSPECEGRETRLWLTYRHSWGNRADITGSTLATSLSGNSIKTWHCHHLTLYSGRQVYKTKPKKYIFTWTRIICSQRRYCKKVYVAVLATVLDQTIETNYKVYTLISWLVTYKFHQGPIETVFLSVFFILANIKVKHIALC